MRLTRIGNRGIDATRVVAFEEAGDSAKTVRAHLDTGLVMEFAGAEADEFLAAIEPFVVKPPAPGPAMRRVHASQVI